MDNTVLVIGVFIVVLLLLEGGYFALRVVRNPEKREIRRRLGTISFEGLEAENVNILRKKLFSTVPWFDRLLSKIPITEKLDRLMEQADVKHPLGVYLLASLLLFFIGLLGGIWVIPTILRVPSNPLLTLLLAVFLPTLPFFYLSIKKNKRLRKFQSQLPEALELISRALRAGHAFSSGLKLVADEMRDPIGAEFDKTLSEINFGVGVPEALKNLANRVDVPDLKFFVISVIIQRETGGNLAEILDNLSHLIRERFKLQGHIRVLSAQGKFSAIVVVAAPYVFGLLVSLLNPKYVQVLFKDPLGRTLVFIALFMTMLGIIAMKKMIAIRV
jgi:tight adherence protein B